MKKNLQNVIKFISSIILIASTLCLIGCPNPNEVDDFTPFMITNVKFEPETVKAGDELTITYSFGDSNKRYDWSKVKLDENGNIIDNNRYAGDRAATNSFISFGFDASDDNIKISYSDKSEIVEFNKWKSTDIHPTKYTEFSKGKVKCIVPDNAKTGYLHLYMVSSLSHYGFPSKKLTVTK